MCRDMKSMGLLFMKRTKSRFGKTSSEKKEMEFIQLNLQTVTQNIKKPKEMTPETQ